VKKSRGEPRGGVQSRGIAISVRATVGLLRGGGGWGGGGGGGGGI